ncbi:hypothetical protein [Solirubrobacter ginsenosidimutans]|uniref:hypothetical protein n=1 Tax=Solirubrobacter ginsenosidimutans TaxID=490573 RepID=UPI0022CDBF98|nr:hypothetical protein [Solirubrobacter ginsenosidimutans]
MVGLALVIWPVPACGALVSLLFGRSAGHDGVRWFSGRLAFLLGLALCAASVVVLVELNNEFGLRLAGAALLGAAVLGVLAIPAVAFYSLGFAVRRGWLAGALWFAGTLPLTAYTVLAGLAYFDLVVCAGGCVFVD